MSVYYFIKFSYKPYSLIKECYVKGFSSENEEEFVKKYNFNYECNCKNYSDVLEHHYNVDEYSDCFNNFKDVIDYINETLTLLLEDEEEKEKEYIFFAVKHDFINNYCVGFEEQDYACEFLKIERIKKIARR